MISSLERPLPRNAPSRRRKRPGSAVRLHGAVGGAAGGAALRGAVGLVEVGPLRGAGWGLGVEHPGQVDLAVKHRTHQNVTKGNIMKGATEDCSSF